MEKVVDTDIAEKKDYEFSFLTTKEESTSEVLRLLSQHQLEVSSEGPLKKINLAYKVGQTLQAFFGYFYLKALPSSVKSLENDLKTNTAILRFLIISLPHKKGVAPVEAPRRRMRPSTGGRVAQELRPSRPLSNEALERKIEEILQ